MPDSALLEYHHRSKHRLDRYAPGPGRLDWANQPDPFRRYAGAAAISLPLAADALPTRYADLRRGELPAMQRFDVHSIAVLFELSLGLSAWKSFRGNRWALRCNPSSGNLHPTEGYLRFRPRVRRRNSYRGWRHFSFHVDDDPAGTLATVAAVLGWLSVSRTQSGMASRWRKERDNALAPLASLASEPAAKEQRLNARLEEQREIADS